VASVEATCIMHCRVVLFLFLYDIIKLVVFTGQESRSVGKGPWRAKLPLCLSNLQVQ
jgi:hypothetical protein